MHCQSMNNDQTKISLNKLTFDCGVSGDINDELIMFLHGFPETSYVFRDLIKDISAKGFYCIAPNLRGYSAGARPSGKKHYTIDKLATDILIIAQSTGKEKFHLVGHDWGAAIGWKVAHDHPNAVISLSALSVPHPQSFFEAIVNDPDQHKKSRYVRMFQMPFLPEMRMKSNDFALLRKIWRDQTDDEVEDYLNVVMEKGALKAMLNYYRANYRHIKKAGKEPMMGDIHVPTLFIWGNKDIAIGPVAVENSHQYMKGDYEYMELEAGHWLIQTRYTDVKDAIIKHVLKTKIN